MIRSILAALVATAAAAQQPVGELVYRTEPGRAITLTLMPAGRVRPERGEAERFRRFVLQHCHRQSSVVAVWIHAGQAPAGWRLKGPGGRDLLRGGGIVYWRYAQDHLLPVTFTFEGKAWSLLSAELPPDPLTGP